MLTYEATGKRIQKLGSVQCWKDGRWACARYVNGRLRAYGAAGTVVEAIYG